MIDDKEPIDCTFRALDGLIKDLLDNANGSREISKALSDPGIKDTQPQLQKLMESLIVCSTIVQKAMDWCDDKANTPKEAICVQQSYENEVYSDGAESQEPIQTPEVSIRPRRLLRANAGVYDSDEPPLEVGIPLKESKFSNRVKLETVNHLLFVIHGIGEHGDFKESRWDDSTDNPTKKSRQFREILRATRDTYFTSEIPLALEIQSIEWHDELHSTGVDDIFDCISPDGSQRLRQFNKRAFMDLLYYSYPKYGQMIVDSVISQLNSKHKRFLDQHPGWHGQISIFAHSLGSVIAYDILTHEHGETTTNGITFSKLNFSIENLFCAGSPVPIMALSRGQINLEKHGKSQPSVRMPQCGRYFNFIHSSDPIAYRVDPLVHGHDQSSCPLPIVDSSFQTKMFAEFVALLDATPTCIDLLLKRTSREGGMMELAYAPFSHKSYWTSQEVAFYMLMQICQPVVQIVRRYIAADLPPPELSPRRFVSFTPHKKIDYATSVVARDRITGAWHPRVVLLASKHLYIVSNFKDIGCVKSWSVDVTSKSSVIPIDEMAFKFTPDSNSPSVSYVLSTGTVDQRNAWVDTIQERISQNGRSKDRVTRCDGLESSPGTSIDYFGAIKTSTMTSGWSTKWIVLTKGNRLIAFESCPKAELWWQFSITTVFVSKMDRRFRFVSPDGTAFVFKIQDQNTFDVWCQAISERKHCNMIDDDTKP